MTVSLCCSNKMMNVYLVDISRTLFMSPFLFPQNIFIILSGWWLVPWSSFSWAGLRRHTKFKLQLRYHVHFGINIFGRGMNFLINNTDTARAWKNFRFISSERSDFHLFLSIEYYVLPIIIIDERIYGWNIWLIGSEIRPESNLWLVYIFIITFLTVWSPSNNDLRK